MIILDDIIQGSSEWYEKRLGNPGASSMNKIITATGKPSSQAAQYETDMFNETITRRPVDGYSNWKMKEKLEREWESREDWELKHDIEIIQVGICYKDEQRLFHFSPDGLMPDIRWGFETKDADANVQIERLADHEKGGRSFLMQHNVQVQSSLWMSGYKKWVLQSYCHNMKPLTLEVEPDLEFHKKLEEQLYKFIGKLQLRIKRAKEAGWIIKEQN